MFPRPRPVRRFAPLERLTFDPRLQMRALPDGQTFDPEWVAELREKYQAGTRFGPLVAVGLDDPLWVIAGFHRGEVYRLEEVPSIEVDILPGTFVDARLWALSENHDHGQRRKPGDLTKAIGALLDDKALFARVDAERRRHGASWHDTLAAACGATPRTVIRALDTRGLRVYAGQIVAKPPSVVAAIEVTSPVGQAEPEVTDEQLADLVKQGGVVGQVAAELLEKRAEEEEDEPGDGEDEDEKDEEDTGLADDDGSDGVSKELGEEEKAAKYLELAIAANDGLAGLFKHLAEGPWAKVLKEAGKRKWPEFGADGQRLANAVRATLKAVERKVMPEPAASASPSQ